MGKIYFVTGGANSGKSDFAEELCQKLGNSKLYIATAKAFDNSFKEKIKKHKIKRENKNWDLVEEYKNLSAIIKNSKNDVILIDCVTMIISNFMFIDYKDRSFSDEKERMNLKNSIEKEFSDILSIIDKVEKDIVIVSNEIGLGVMPRDKISILFMKIAGQINKLIALNSNEVYFVISGIGNRIK